MKRSRFQEAESLVLAYPGTEHLITSQLSESTVTIGSQSVVMGLLKLKPEITLVNS